MKKQFLTLLTALCSLTATAADGVNLDSLYRVLDAAIDSSAIYVKQKEDRINSLKDDLRRARDDRERYDYAEHIYQEYTPTDNDSAIAYQYLCLSLAEKMGREDLHHRAAISLASQLGNSGFYNEARIHYGKVDPGRLDEGLREQYLIGENNLYGEMAYYTHDPALKAEFYARQDAIRDSMMAELDPASLNWLFQKTIVLNYTRRLDEALHYSDQWMKVCEPGSRDYATMAFFRSEIFKGYGSVEKQRYWLLQAAIIDVRNAIMDQGALWSLANSLMRNEGDLERAHRYIDFSWRCISRFSPHMRAWQISPILTKINDEYKSQLKSMNTRLQWTVGIISGLTLVMLLLLAYVSKKRKQLDTARNELAQTNRQLNQLNRQLRQANEEMKEKNLQLHDSNRVKEEYITKFLGLCSAYIDKLEAYRIKINRKAKANQHADILKMTSSQQMKEEELKELVVNFDNVFLHLFPTFVVDFNALLKPGSRIALNDDGSMTTDMRIFALIRLGLEESSRIAEFLGYSPNSIYNYRARMKNKAAGDRETFEQQVKQIGLR